MPIGAIKQSFFQAEVKFVKRENYYRIFKDDKEIEEIKKDKNEKEKMKDINYLTIE